MAHYYRTKRRNRYYYADLHTMYLRMQVAHTGHAVSPDPGVQHRALELLDEPETMDDISSGPCDGLQRGVLFDEYF